MKMVPCSPNPGDGIAQQAASIVSAQPSGRANSSMTSQVTTVATAIAPAPSREDPVRSVRRTSCYSRQALLRCLLVLFQERKACQGGLDVGSVLLVEVVNELVDGRRRGPCFRHLPRSGSPLRLNGSVSTLSMNSSGLNGSFLKSTGGWESSMVSGRALERPVKAGPFAAG